MSEIETAIDFIDVRFINQKQTVSVDGKQVELEQGQFEFKTFYGDPIDAKYHIDIGPGVPEETKFDIIVAGVKANEFIVFNPTPKGGCPVANCFNRELNITINTIPTPTPTPIPPTPTPVPTVNPSFYSGQIIIGSSPVQDGVDVFAKIEDYISEVVVTSEGRYTINVNPKTVNYVGQNIYLIIQGNQSIPRRNQVKLCNHQLSPANQRLKSQFLLSVGRGQRNHPNRYYRYEPSRPRQHQK